MYSDEADFGSNSTNLRKQWASFCSHVLHFPRCANSVLVLSNTNLYFFFFKKLETLQEIGFDNYKESLHR